MGYTIPFYAYTTDRFGGARNHRGHDVAPGGQMFPSWVVGTVVQSYSQSCLGNVVVVRNDADGYYIGVSHLASRSVGVGQRVGIGTGLGPIGNTGSCTTGRHAHITVSPSSQFPESGQVIDPVQYANQATPNLPTSGGGGSLGYGYGLNTAAQLALQKAMAHENRYSGALDGVFGSASVKGMQQWLKDMGYLQASYVVDGDPGELYGTALQELARDKGGYTGKIDGLPGDLTSAALKYWAEVVVIANGGGSSSEYAYGLTEASQKACQAALTKLQLYTGLIDGVFGPASVAAMQTYLKNVGLLEADYGVDGKPGPLYGTALQNLAAKHGYTGALDGVPGDMTSAALERWAATITTIPTTPTPPTPPVDSARRWPLTGTFGIDVASPQRDIDFGRAKADGAEFAIIKMGGLNVTPQYRAPYYVQQVTRARAAGLKIGHYYLIGLGQTPEAQAQYFVANLHDFRPAEDVLALDNEKLDGNGTKWDDAAAGRFLTEVRRLTGLPEIRVWHYGGASDYRAAGVNGWPIVEAQGEIWWAAYGANNGTRDHDPSLQGSVSSYRVHQFSSTVPIAGYNLDGNWSPLELDALFATGTVVPTPEPEPEPEPDGAAAALAYLVGAVRAAATTAEGMVND